MVLEPGTWSCKNGYVIDGKMTRFRLSLFGIPNSKYSTLLWVVLTTTEVIQGIFRILFHA